MTSRDDDPRRADAKLGDWDDVDMQRLIARARHGEMLDALAAVQNALADIWTSIAQGTRKAKGMLLRSFEKARAKATAGKSRTR